MEAAIFFAFLIATCVFVVVLGVKTMRETWRRRHWPGTYATIKEAEIFESFSRDPDERVDRKTYGIVVRYEYTLLDEAKDGQRSARVHAGSFRSSTTTSVRGWCEAKLGTYPVGGRLRVYYDPLDHGSSALGPEASRSKSSSHSSVRLRRETLHERQAFTARAEEFSGAGVRVVGVSGDPMKRHDKFIAKYDLKFPLASDVDGGISEAFGTWIEKSMYGRKYMGMERSTFLIDADGNVVQAWRGVKVKGHAEVVLAAATR